jgi:hypothetical protein
MRRLTALLTRLANALGSPLAPETVPAARSPAFTPSAPLAPPQRLPRPDLGANQLLWCERRIAAFRACRRAAMRSRAAAAKAEARTKGDRSAAARRAARAG